MKQFDIVTDSTCDLGKEWLEEHDVTMVPLSVFCGEDVFLDQIEITPEQYYEKMLASEELPHSSQPSPDTFLNAFRGLADAGSTKVLSIHIAEVLSGTANSARIAAGMLEGCDVTVYDSCRVTITHGIMVREAVRMRDAGETLEATVAHLDELRRSLQLYIVPETLENLVKNGRLSKLAGGAIALLGIKLVIVLDEEGTLTPKHKVRGTKRAFASVIKDLEEAYPNHDPLLVQGLTVRNPEGCATLVSQVEAAGFPLERLDDTSAGPVIATHAGLGLVALAVAPQSALYQG